MHFSTRTHLQILMYIQRKKQIKEKKSKNQNGRGTGFKQNFGSPISPVHFPPLTQLQILVQRKRNYRFKKTKQKNSSGPGFKETFGSPISPMHFWALTHLQTVMCASIEECQSVPVSKRTWSLYATTTKHLNIFFSWEFAFSHIWAYCMSTSLNVCLPHFGSLLFWTNDAQISKQIQYVVRITMTLRLFPSLPDHTT